MILIKPVKVTSNVLFITTAEDEVFGPDFDMNTTYIAGNHVSHNNRWWECLSDTSLGVTPVQGVTWLDLGPTNVFAMFDGANGSVTTAVGSLIIALQPGVPITAIGLVNMTGVQSVTLQIRDSNDAVIYNQTHLTAQNANATQMAILDLPDGYTNSTIFVTLNIAPTASITSCGNMVIGTPVSLGSTQYGASLGITDYSKKSTDAFGKYTFLKRDYSSKMDVDLIVPTHQIDDVLTTLVQYRSTPCLWIGEPAQPSTIVFGFYKDFNINLKNAINCDCSIQIEGLT